MSTGKDNEINALLTLLCSRYPKTFFMYQERRKPLKIGIHKDIAAALGDGLDRKLLSAAMRCYCQNIGYLKAQTLGAERIDLNGEAAGAVSETDMPNVRSTLAGLRLRRARQRLSAVDQVLRALCAQFPKAFAVYQLRRQPLKLGIEADITAALGEVAGLDAVLRAYSTNECYLRALRPGAVRLDLNGEAAGAVTTEEAAVARAQLAQLAQRKPKATNNVPLTSAEVNASEPPRIEAPAAPQQKPKLTLAGLKEAAQRRKAQQAAA